MARAPPRVAAVKTSAAVDDLRDDCRELHRLEHALRRGVGAEGHVDAGGEVAGEGLHRDAAAGEDPDGVGDRGTAAGDDAEVVGVVVGPGAAAEDDGVAEDDVGCEEADRLQPLDRGFRVAAGHFLELVNRLADVDLDWHPEAVGLAADLAQQPLAAGVDLQGREEGLDQTIVGAIVALDEVDRAA